MPRKQQCRRVIAIYPPSICLYISSFPSLPYAGAPQAYTPILNSSSNHQVPLLCPTLKIMMCTIAMLLVGPGTGLYRKDPCHLMHLVSWIGTGSALVVCIVEKVP